MNRFDGEDSRPCRCSVAAAPGQVEVDLVSHDGRKAAGDYCYTLTVTDRCSGWTEIVPVPSRAQVFVFTALTHVLTPLPFGWYRTGAARADSHKYGADWPNDLPTAGANTCTRQTLSNTARTITEKQECPSTDASIAKRHGSGECTVLSAHATQHETFSGSPNQSHGLPRAISLASHRSLAAGAGELAKLLRRLAGR